MRGRGDVLVATYRLEHTACSLRVCRRGSAPHRPIEEAVTAIAALFDFGTGSEHSWDAYDRVNRELGAGQTPATAAELGDGMLAHFAGNTQDGRSMIVNVFESQEAMDRFMERVTPLMQREVEAAGGPEPRVEILDLHNVLT